MTEIIQKSKSTTIVYYCSAVFFSLALALLGWVMLALGSRASELSGAVTVVAMILLAIIIFSVYSIKKQSQSPDYEVSETQIKNLKTGETQAFKDIGDVYFFSTGKIYGLLNNVAFRTTENSNFQTISLAVYKSGAIDIFLKNYVPARTTEVLAQAHTGKTVSFQSIDLKSRLGKQAFATGPAAFLNIETQKISLSKTSLTVKDIIYQLTDLLPINFSESGGYIVENKLGDVIFSFTVFSLMSAEVFRLVFNELVRP